MAAAVIGPPLARDWARPLPKDLPMAAAGAGLLWLDWNGFNGGGQPRPTPPHPTPPTTQRSHQVPLLHRVRRGDDERTVQVVAPDSSAGGIAVRRLLRAQSWLLLAFTGDDAAVDGGLDLARDTPWLAVRTVTTRMPAQQRPGFRSDDRTVPDPDGWVHRALGAGAGTWILVRPDGYVAARGVLGKDELGAAVASLCETLAMTGHQLPAVPV